MHLHVIYAIGLAWIQWMKVYIDIIYACQVQHVTCNWKLYATCFKQLWQFLIACPFAIENHGIYKILIFY